ncbi:MAG: hypothetical protein ABGX25_02880 [Nautiliaceae bacterium]
MRILKNMWYDLETRGKIFENVGLGFFVNAGYGITLSDIQLMNWIDAIIGIILMLSGIYLQRREKWDK